MNQQQIKKQMPKRIEINIDPILLFMLAAVVFIFSHCSSKHVTKSSVKAKTEKEATTDLTAVKKTDSSGTKTVESSAVKENNSSEVKTTTTDATETITVILDTSTGVPANDFEGAPKVFDVVVNGHQVHSNKPIKSIVIENKQGKQVIEAYQVANSDSSGSRTVETATRKTADSLALIQQLKEKQELEARNKEVVKKVYWLGSWGTWIILLCAFGLSLYFGWWPKLFAWVRRKLKRQPVNPLHSVKYEPPVPPDGRKE